MDQDIKANPDRAALTTRRASKQAYYTIYLLADRDLKADAFRAYAYFRWLDDRLDTQADTSLDGLALIRRQKDIIRRLYNGVELPALSPDEMMLAELVRNKKRPNGGLHAYIHHMMAVLEFDVNRRGRLIQGRELSEYSLHLATAVTEALHFFIGNGKVSPASGKRYLAAMGAHTTHMLRDTQEDTELGYYNIPIEFLQRHRIKPQDFSSEPFQLWVKARLEYARRCFLAGHEYLKDVGSLRCRIAGRLYMARFERILDLIEKDGYILRPTYSRGEMIAAGFNL
ncbi:MAG: squalene/phytoene synthase family protein [Anaerolineales bacterium]|nr:squalene/phytoene synthase family protein [Anaerolineales bacterium]